MTFNLCSDKCLFVCLHSIVSQQSWENCLQLFRTKAEIMQGLQIYGQYPWETNFGLFTVFSIFKGNGKK